MARIITWWKRRFWIQSHGPVWVHFGFRSNNKGVASNEKKVTSKICRKKVLFKRANDTNLKLLQLHHPQQFATTVCHLN